MRKLVSLFLALCLLCAAIPALAETAEKQEIKVGSVTFQVPAAVAEEGSDVGIWSASCSDYTLIISVNDWSTYDIPLSDLTDGNIQIDSMFGSLVIGGFDGDTAITIASSMCHEENIGMLNGDPVRQGAVGDTVVFCSHYYRDHGVLIACTTETSFSTDDMLAICDEIMLSARFDGVTEEDMIADAQVDYVIVTADSGKIRTEPSISGGLLKTAYKGETYELIEESGDWYIIDVDGRTAYLHTGVAEIQ
ncbi:MAG: SH3 domain-containing protein [Clostridia bacterium]|nr:SH3 domain-containing protein [Clostridia bacterium]